MNFIEKLGLLLFIAGSAEILETRIKNKEAGIVLGNIAVIIGTLAFLLGELVGM